MTTLDKISTGELATIVEIDTELSLKQRLYDVGFVPNTRVKVIHQSPAGNPRAYLVRRAVIALRNCDAQRILVRADSNE